MADTLQLWLYHLEQWATQLVQGQLQHLSPLSLLLVGLAGLVTSLSPCMLSLLPVTIGYIGGYAPTTPAAAGEVRWQVWVQSLGFAAGVALTLSGLGLGAALLGRVYGQTAAFGSLVAGGIAILMGLNLLEVVPLRFPDWFNRLEIPGQWPGLGRSVLLGSTFGLVASPCSTPVLVALLGWVSTTGQPWVGGGLLLAYALGLVSPLLLAGVFAGSMKQLLALRRWSIWFTYASGVVLVGFGTVTILSAWA
ncbi:MULTISPECIES: cytochrome c biogenesis protein CcdA [unclassified Synechococcus]|jgi:cytochrome c-type biogenesis protein|uniref:cytochrome c biogenesis protein CcdA n=1 Tax=unclassified Synechococcus TaxID=2626047 RepID=UPI0000693F9A|nr:MULTISPECIES: cytochrome c biogenesis protein CcdA [unclassified Synechococcus]ABC98475.1 cytochrome c biogenesis membrane protein [Synechococcus sp. JA-3-3Ab]